MIKNDQILIPPVICLMQKNEFPLEFRGLNLKEVDSCTESPLLVWFLLLIYLGGLMTVYLAV